ncbi:NACHT, LRR and PYD domains-containing protein 12-like [Rhinophrynus dorsalis]
MHGKDPQGPKPEPPMQEKNTSTEINDLDPLKAQIEVPDGISEDCRIKYMESVKEKYQLIEDRNSPPGETVHLKRRYTTVQRIQKHIWHDKTDTFSRHAQIMTNRSTEEYSPTTIQTLFDPDEQGRSPRTVVLVGPAGIGKTVTSQKIMLDWASGDLYQDRFSYVFYISCREFNNITGAISIARILLEKCQLKCTWNQIKCILRDPSKLLFIIDGLDELKKSYITEYAACVDPFLETRKEIILSSLFRKRVLKEASLIITTRPSTLEKIRDYIQMPRYVEILGITDEDREQFFYHFFENKEQADMALDIVKANKTLFTMCSVPFTCWSVCIVMKQKMGKILNVINAKTSTSVYMLYLKSLLNYHGPEPDLCMKTCMKKLCALANEGVFDRKIVFEEEDLKKHGLTESDIKYLFQNESIFQKDIETNTCYSFSHHSVQEFFAALYYVLSEGTDSGEGSVMDDEGTENRDSKEDPSYKRDIWTLLEKSDSYLNQQLILSVRFLFGLLSEQQLNETEKLFGCKMTQEAKDALEQWLKETKLVSDGERLNCLYETQDVELVRRMMSHFLHLRIRGSSVSPTALSYCLMNSTSDHTIDFNGYIMDKKSQDILSPFLHRCTRLELWNCELTSASCEDLRSVIITNRSLTKLDLRNNDLQNSGVKRLCDGLRHPDCTLQELRLSGSGLTSAICEDLRSVIITNRYLTKLDLSNNNLQDSGVKHLCDGLRHPHCTLQDLRLALCNMTKGICKDFHYVFITNRSLTTLDLGYIKLYDSELRLLHDGLRHPDCTLQELR